MPTLTNKNLRDEAQALIIGPLRVAENNVDFAESQREQKNRELARLLREMRERENVSLRDVAKQLGFSAAYVSDVELGNRCLSEKFAENYVNAIIQLR